MTDDGSSEYFRDRNRASIVMSLSAAGPSVRDIHLTLADRYVKLADGSIDVAAGTGNVVVAAAAETVPSTAQRAAVSTLHSLPGRRPRPVDDGGDQGA